jgi:hypothetical protein
LRRLAYQAEELAGLLPELRIRHEPAPVADRGELLLHPALEDGTFVLAEDLG